MIFGNLFSFFFFFFFCLHVEGDFVFSFLLLFGISSRTTHRFDRPWSWRGKINKQRRCARKSAELVLVAFFAAVPLWKRVSVCTWYKWTFLGGFFLVGSTFNGYVGQETHQPTAKNRISRHRYTKVRFSRKNPPFYLKHVLKLRPWYSAALVCTGGSDKEQVVGGPHVWSYPGKEKFFFHSHSSWSASVLPWWFSCNS